jgi:hypothetical protein
MYLRPFRSIESGVLMVHSMAQVTTWLCGMFSALTHSLTVVHLCRAAVLALVTINSAKQLEPGAWTALSCTMRSNDCSSNSQFIPFPRCPCHRINVFTGLFIIAREEDAIYYYPAFSELRKRRPTIDGLWTVLMSDDHMAGTVIDPSCPCVLPTTVSLVFHFDMSST